MAYKCSLIVWIMQRGVYLCRAEHHVMHVPSACAGHPPRDQPGLRLRRSVPRGFRAQLPARGELLIACSLPGCITSVLTALLSVPGLPAKVGIAHPGARLLLKAYFGYHRSSQWPTVGCL